MIFVQIASYRDKLLRHTIKSLIDNAEKPEALKICICRQYHPNDGFDCLDDYRTDKRFIIIDILYLKSKGVCWARHLIQKYYGGEKFSMQIDAHMIFKKNWDSKLITMLETLQQDGFAKPIITTYPPEFSPKLPNKELSDNPTYLFFAGFDFKTITQFGSITINDNIQLSRPLSAKFYSAGFAFSVGKFNQEVRYDPELYFNGEELSITVRAFTSGYDLFHPNEVVIWHKYYDSDHITHWKDNKSWAIKNKKSLNKVKYLLGINCQIKRFKKYGLGNQRSLNEYESFSGLDFKNMGITNFRQRKKIDYNPLGKKYYYRCFTVNYDIVFLNFKEKQVFIEFRDCNDKKIYKKPIKKKFLRRATYKKLNSKLILTFYSLLRPIKWVMLDKASNVIYRHDLIDWQIISQDHYDGVIMLKNV